MNEPERAVSRATVRFAALVGLLSCSVAAAYGPTIDRELMPPDLSPEVRQHLEGLYSENEKERIAAAIALGRMGPAAVQSAPFLASMLTGHFSVESANQAAQALVRIGKGAFDSVAATADTPGGDGRRRAVLVLVRIDGARATPVLLRRLAVFPPQGYDLFAFRLAGEPAKEQVMRAAESPEAELRRAAARALPAFARISVHSGHDIGGHGTGDGGGHAWCQTKPVVDCLIRLVGDPDSEVRLAALQSLAQIPSEPGMKMPPEGSLQAALKDPAPALRLEAVGLILATDETDKLKFEALEPLLADPDPAVRGKTVSGLGRLAKERTRIIPLLANLLKDGSSEVRAQAALALGGLRAVEAEGPLLAALEKDDSRPVRAAAARAFGQMGGRTGTEALICMFNRDPDPMMRLEAVEALSIIYQGCCERVRKRPAKTAAKAALTEDEWAGLDAMFEVLSRAMSDPIYHFHLPAIEALGRTPREANKDLIPSLILGLKSVEWQAGNRAAGLIREAGYRDDRLLAACHERLKASNPGKTYDLVARMKDPRSIPVLEEEALKGGRGVGTPALGTLLAFGEPGRQAVLRCLGHPEVEVRKRVAQAFAYKLEHEGARLADFVRSALAGGDENLRDGIQRALALVSRPIVELLPPERQVRELILTGELSRSSSSPAPDAKTVQAAKLLLNDSDPSVRAGAAALSGAAKDPPPAASMLKLLADESAQVRAQAAETLGRLVGREALPALTTALQDPEEGVREAAAAALGRLGGPEAAEALLAALQSPAWGLRRAAAAALGGLDDAASAEALRKALSGDPHWCVRRAAAAALGRKRDGRPDPILIAALEDEHWLVRLAAHQALLAVTGQKLGPEAEAWRKRLEQAGPGAPQTGKKD